MHLRLPRSVGAALRRLVLAAALAGATGLAWAGVIHVTIDTARFGAASGYLDLQLSAGAGVPLATATISNLAGFGGATIVDSFGVAAAGAGYVFRNDTSNSLFQSMAFGGLLSFDLSFAGAVDPLTQYVSHFQVAAYDEGFAALGSADPVSGALADFAWTPARAANGSGSVAIRLFDPAAVSAVPEAAGPVPEPGAAWLMGGGGVAMALAALGRRRRRDTAACVTR